MFVASQDGETRAGEETTGTYLIKGYEPELTTSRNNYKCSLFSFQQCCMNQSTTKSIGIHLKEEIRTMKKRKSSIQPSRKDVIDCPLWVLND